MTESFIHAPWTESQPVSEPINCNTYGYRVSRLAEVGALAIGLANPRQGVWYTHLVRVVEPGAGAYETMEPVIHPASGKLVQVYPPELWEEFTDAIKQNELQ